MFKINNQEPRERMSRKEGARRRQIVYTTILGNPDKKFTAKQLAEAAGYNMSAGTDSKEYKAGIAFIDNMQRHDYIAHDIPTSRDGNSWYVHGKEKVECEHLLKETEPTTNGIEDRANPNHLVVSREVKIEESSDNNGEVPVIRKKETTKTVPKQQQKFDIVIGIYQHGVDDPNNASLELEGKTTNEIVDAIRALTAIL